MAQLKLSFQRCTQRRKEKENLLLSVSDCCCSWIVRMKYTGTIMREHFMGRGLWKLGFEEWMSLWRDGETVRKEAELEGQRHRNACMVGWAGLIG